MRIARESSYGRSARYGAAGGRSIVVMHVVIDRKGRCIHVVIVKFVVPGDPQDAAVVDSRLSLSAKDSGDTALSGVPVLSTSSC